jgi:hypothetical protein
LRLSHCRYCQHGTAGKNARNRQWHRLQFKRHEYFSFSNLSKWFYTFTNMQAWRLRAGAALLRRPRLPLPAKAFDLVRLNYW